MRKHYQREDLGEGVRGKHHAAYVNNSKLACAAHQKRKGRARFAGRFF